MTEVWVRRYDNLVTNAQDEAIQMALDPQGNIVVVGSSQGGFGPGQIVTVKYSADLGSVLWERRYIGPGDSFARAVAVDATGNVVVAGHTTSKTNGWDFYTAKYAAADGTLLWEQHHNEAKSNDEAWAVAIDSKGNVAVAGTAFGGSSGYDYYTAKYAAADGALLWERRYDRPAHGPDMVAGATVDANDNIIVTGYSAGAGNDLYDFYTVKYAAADGAVLWEKRHNGDAGGDDRAQAIKIDANGNVAVTGISFDPQTLYNYYTVKYAAADGALLWEKRYNGPASADDSATALALDESGNVVVAGTSMSRRCRPRLLHSQICGGRWRVAVGKALQWSRQRARSRRRSRGWPQRERCRYRHFPKQAVFIRVV